MPLRDLEQNYLSVIDLTKTLDIFENVVQTLCVFKFKHLQQSHSSSLISMSSQWQGHEYAGLSQPASSRPANLQPGGLVGNSLTMLVTGLMLSETRRSHETKNACKRKPSSLDRLSRPLTSYSETWTPNFSLRIQRSSYIVKNSEHP